MAEIYKRDFDDLLGMAEDVSHKVDYFQAKIANMKIVLNICLAISALSLLSAIFYTYQPVMNDTVVTFKFVFFSLISGIIFFFSVFIARLLFSSLRKLQKSFLIELDLLHRLLNMVHEYKENMYSEEIGAVENAVLDMRLSRIKYSGK